MEGPPATDTRENMYSTAFLSGEAGYDIVYCDVIWVPKFAAAGWLLDLTERLSPETREDFLPMDLKAGMYQGRPYRIPAFTYEIPWGLLTAGVIVSTLPLIILVLFFQRRIVEGLTAGALK